MTFQLRTHRPVHPPFTHDRPAVITSAPVSPQESLRLREHRYALMMGLRALCVLGAALVAPLSLLLSLAFVVGGVVLPWCAVLMANDRLPSERPPRPAPTTARPALPAPHGRTIEL